MFSTIFVFQKCYTRNILEMDETKARRPDISQSFQKTEEETEPGQREATPQGSAA
jgi:hypothetical protein